MNTLNLQPITAENQGTVLSKDGKFTVNERSVEEGAFCCISADLPKLDSGGESSCESFSTRLLSKHRSKIIRRSQRRHAKKLVKTISCSNYPPLLEFELCHLQLFGDVSPIS